MNNKDIVIEYLNRFTSGDIQGLESLFAADLMIQGPFHTHNSATDYLESLKSDPPEPSGYEALSLTEGEERVAVFYHCHKPHRTMLIAQLFTLREQKIAEILLVFDST